MTNKVLVGSLAVLMGIIVLLSAGWISQSVYASPGDEIQELYVGTANPGAVYKYIGGTEWDAVSPELGYAVLSLVKYDGHLYAGIMSTSDPMGGIGRVYRYDGGNTWTPVGDNLDNQVSSLVVYNSNLYAGTAWGRGRLYRYNAPNDWTRVVDHYDPGGWAGFRAAYVWDDGYLYLGDIGWDIIGRYNGNTFQHIVHLAGSCIYDFELYNGYLYASAYTGRLFRSSDGINWSVALDYYDGNMWELETFQDSLYMSYNNRQLRVTDGADLRGELVYTAPDGIISMTTDSNNLYFGTGGEAGAFYGSETEGIANIYEYDGTNVTLISGEDQFGAGVQVLYSTYIQPPPPENQPPNPPINLAQFKSDGETKIIVGDTTSERTVIFKGEVSDPDGDNVRLQIELRRLDEYGCEFTGTYTQQSDLVNSGGQASIIRPGLDPGSYHWQARTVDEQGLASNWISFGDNNDLLADFFISEVDIKRYAPTLVFDSNEMYFPTDILGDDLFVPNNHEHYDDGTLPETMDDGKYISYYRVTRDSDFYIIQYWYYYGFNPAYFDHEHDFEVAFFRVMDSGTLESITSSSHHWYNSTPQIPVPVPPITLYVEEGGHGMTPVMSNGEPVNTANGFPFYCDAQGRTLTGATDFIFKRLDSLEYFDAQNLVPDFVVQEEGWNYREGSWQHYRHFYSWGTEPAYTGEHSFFIYPFYSGRLGQTPWYLGNRYNHPETLLPQMTVWLQAPETPELRVYDNGNVTGLVDGEIEMQIPNSDYYLDMVVITSASDSYIYEVVGTKEETYGLEITFTSQEGETNAFDAVDIPTVVGTIYQYTVDWDALSQGEEGVTVQIDFDGDGEFEWTITSDSVLTSDDIPTGSIIINNGANYTNSRNITLTLEATNVSQMCFGNDKSSWSNWENHATSKSWTLTSGDGTKTVYVKFKDNAGNVSEAYSDNIILDTTPPSGSISINNDATYSDSRSVTLSLSASDNLSEVSEMMLSNSSSFQGASWGDYATSKSWTLTSGDGEKKAYVKFKDGAGNVSDVYSGDIILDTTPPTVGITSPSADTSVRGSVVIKGTASDENFKEYKVEYGEGTEPSSWTEITSSTSQVTDDTLATWDTTVLDDGSYTLRLTAEDLAGNSAQTQVSLRVDNHPPETTLIDYPTETVTGNTPKVAVTFTWTGSDPDNITPIEKLVYQYKLEGHLDYQDWSDWSSETAKIYMLPSGNYTFKVRAKDEAGNYPDENDPATAKSSFTVSLPLIIYPNPCYPNQGQTVIIASLPLSSEVKIYIYDLGGNLVRTLGESDARIEGGSKTATWDCRNDNGEVVTRDVYIYFIPSATEKKTGKIAIMK